MTAIEQRAYEAIVSMAKKDTPDYWTRLEHTYAGMAMQGMLNNGTLLSIVLKGLSHEEFVKEIAKAASNYAHALVEKIKEERE